MFHKIQRIHPKKDLSKLLFQERLLFRMTFILTSHVFFSSFIHIFTRTFTFCLGWLLCWLYMYFSLHIYILLFIIIITIYYLTISIFFIFFFITFYSDMILLHRFVFEYCSLYSLSLNNKGFAFFFFCWFVHFSKFVSVHTICPIKYILRLA